MSATAVIPAWRDAGFESERDLDQWLDAVCVGTREPRGQWRDPDPPRSIDVGELGSLATAAEACGVLRCSRRTLARLVATGRLRAAKRSHGGSSPLLIPRAELRRYLDALQPGEWRRRR
jgi:excisionase family DNA binding protein